MFKFDTFLEEKIGVQSSLTNWATLNSNVISLFVQRRPTL